jgi:hypothetical protein
VRQVGGGEVGAPEDLYTYREREREEEEERDRVSVRAGWRDSSSEGERASEGGSERQGETQSQRGAGRVGEWQEMRRCTVKGRRKDGGRAIDRWSERVSERGGGRE